MISKIKCFLILLYLFPTLCFAEKRLAVLEIRGVGFESNELRLYTDLVRSGIVESIDKRTIDGQKLLVVSKENMVDMLKSMGKGVEDCQGECEVELARNMGADYVVSGEIVKIEQLNILTLRIHETTRGVFLSGVDIKEEDNKKLLDSIKISGSSLISKSIKFDENIPVTEQNSLTDGQINGQTKEEWSIPDEQPEVAILFETNPSGASVFLNGKFLCSETPCTKYLLEGVYEVRFALQRYEEKIINTNIVKGTVLKSDLKPLFGVAKVNSNPSDVEIFHKEISWGRTPFTKEVDPGNYIITVKDPCFEPAIYKFQMLQ